MKKRSKMLCSLFACALAMSTFTPTMAYAADASVESEDGRDRFFANGNAIILEEGETEGYTVVYLDKNSDGVVDSEDEIVTISEATGSADETGYDLEDYSIFGGSSSDLESDTQITMLGGTVGLIYGGNYNSDLVGDVSIDIQGGKVMNQVYGGGVSSDTVGDVSLIFGEDAFVQWVVYAGGNADATTFGNVTIELATNAGISKVYVGGNNSTVLSYEEVVIVGDESLVDVVKNYVYDAETAPEITDPEVTDPEVTDPEVTDPEVTDPEVTDPEVTDPEVTDPEVTDPEVTDPEEPTMEEGNNQVVNAGEPAMFQSSAAYEDFKNILINSVELDADSYTVTEGGTIIILKSEYTATLSAGEYEISIVSETGTATASFTVIAEEVKDEDVEDEDIEDEDVEDEKAEEPSDTGDSNGTMIWSLGLCVLASGLASGYLVYKKKMLQ